MVSYGFGRFRPVFVGSGPHFLEKRVQEIKSFFFQFSTFFHIKKKIFENLCKIFSKNIFLKVLIFCRRKKMSTMSAIIFMSHLFIFFKNVSFST